MSCNLIIFTICLITRLNAMPPGAIGADLILDTQRMQQSLYISEETYTSADCEINECLMHLQNGPFPTTRKLLRFDTRAVNIGNRDFNLGSPFDSSNFNFVYDPCHQHYHFEDFAEYQVFSTSDTNRLTNLVPETGKRAFCLMDSAPARPALYNGPRSGSSRFTCANQGISVGWQDIYGANLDCQFVDITDLPPGDYMLVVLLNPVGSLNEVDRTNNEGILTFTIGGTGPMPGDERCRVPRPEWLGDGYCDRTGRYNTRDCNWDRGDCCTDCCRNGGFECGSNGYDCRDPNCEILETPEMIDGTGIQQTCEQLVDIPQWVGDGYCDGPEYNIQACNYDGGDCCESTCVAHANSQALSASGPLAYLCGQGGYNCIAPNTA